MASITGIGAVMIFWSFLGGCVSWQPAWGQADTSDSRTDVSGLLQEAQRLSGSAQDKAALQAANAVYEKILVQDPSHNQALVSLGHQYILFGAAVMEKISSYLEKMLRPAERLDSLYLKHDSMIA